MSVKPRPIYVDASGSDTEGNGTFRHPFATVERANALRVQWSFGAQATADQVVYVAPGDYFNTEIEITNTSMCARGFTLNYENTGALGDARLIGGYPASGWTVHAGSIYKIPLATPCSTLYENGVRAVSARLPILNPGVDYPCAFAPYFLTTGVIASYSILQYDPLDFDPTPWAVEDIRLRCWGTLNTEIDWFQDTMQVESENLVTHRLFAANDGMKFQNYNVGGGRYFVQGPPDLIQGPGEFAWSAGFLYYWPRATPIADQEIIIPTVKTVVSMLGTSTAAPIKHISWEGFTVGFSDFNNWYRMGTNGIAVEYDYFNSLVEFRQGGFRLENAEHIQIESNDIACTGFAGIFMQGHCRHVTAHWNHIHKTGTDGISVNGMPPGGGQLSRDNLFDDQEINDMGQLDGGANGIRISQSGYNVIRYHHIYNGPRRGIWMHGDFDVAPEDIYTRGNYAHHNLIEAVCQDSGDVGGLTMSFFASPPGGPSQIPVNRLDQTIIRNIHAHPSMLNVPPNGFFYDNHSSGQVASNIQISDTQGPPQRNNDADDWIFTNVSWLPGFDVGLMDTANIGTTADFPY